MIKKKQKTGPMEDPGMDVDPPSFVLFFARCLTDSQTLNVQ